MALMNQHSSDETIAAAASAMDWLTEKPHCIPEELECFKTDAIDNRGKHY